MASPYGLFSGGEVLGALRLLSSTVGPSDQWRLEEDRTATGSNTLSVQACVSVGVKDLMMECWFRVTKF